MQALKAITIFAFLLAFLPSATSQTSTNKNFESLASVESNLLNLEGDDFTFFSGEENNTYYLDFDKISSNLKEIHVVNQSGEVIFKDELWNLPVDTIYEIDLTKYEKGNYKILVKTFTEDITKMVNVI